MKIHHILSEDHIFRIFYSGEKCLHFGCLSHISHPCEGCGRIGGRGDVLVTNNPLYLLRDSSARLEHRSDNA